MAEQDGQEIPAKSAAEQRLEAEVRAAEAKSAQDKAALERVRRKLTRLMLVSLTVTFIALAIVAAAIFYKIAHTRPALKAAPQNFDTAAEQKENIPPASAALKQAAPQTASSSQNLLLDQDIMLETGEELQEAFLSGNLVLLRVGKKATQEVNYIIYDYVKRQTVARLKPKNPQ